MLRPAGGGPGMEDRLEGPVGGSLGGSSGGSVGGPVRGAPGDPLGDPLGSPTGSGFVGGGAGGGWRRGWRRPVALGLGAVLVLLLGLAGGFAVFLDRAWMRAPGAGAPSAGIAVLTGGPERVETGLGLLLLREDGRLIVSGVGPESGLAELARRAGLEAADVADRTALGREATSTRGNAREVAAWARAAGMREITVVTAGFHMPRALLELRRAMPEGAFRPHPVPPFVARPVPMLREYLKLLGAGLGLSVLAERPRRVLP